VIAALGALADRVEAAAGADRALDAEIAMAVFPPLRALQAVSPGIWIDEAGGRVRALRYTGSRTAATTLVPIGHWLMGTIDDGEPVTIHSPDENAPVATGCNPSAALSIAAAALRARAFAA
jgi:hypothetical protein